MNLEQLVLARVRERGAKKSCCPSEMAREWAASRGEEDWRQYMEPVREAARRLEAQGRLVFLQKGRRVNSSELRGPVRLRWVPPPSA